MATSRNGLDPAVKFLGSDLSGMPQPPEGVHELMEDLRNHADMPRLQFRIVTREVGGAGMKRITVRGVKNDRFVEMRVNPDCGGNDNCWLASVVLEQRSDEQKIRAAAETINNRRPERKTPAPAQPETANASPYAALGLAELRNRRLEFVEKRDSAEKGRAALLGLKQSHDAQEQQRLQNIETLETNLQRERNELACLREHMKEADRGLTNHGQTIVQCDRELEKINAAIDEKVRAAAREIADPLRAMMREEAEKRGVPVEEIIRELTAAPTSNS